MVYYNITVNISMCYSNPTIVNMYTYYCKLVYKIILNGGGYRIIYFVATYRVYSLSLYIYIYIEREVKFSYSRLLTQLLHAQILS